MFVCLIVFFLFVCLRVALKVLLMEVNQCENGLHACTSVLSTIVLPILQSNSLADYIRYVIF